MKRITLDKITNLILFMYIISLYLFTYVEGLFVISNALALLFVLMVFIKILSNKKIIFNKYLRYHFLFIFICLGSFFYAMSQGNVISEVRTLVLTFIVMVALANHVDTTDKINWVIKSFIISGLVASIYIIFISDFTHAIRFGSELGNVNDIGMIIGISSIFSINEYFRFNKKSYLIILIPMVIVILLTGSRKSLLFIFIATLFILYWKNRNSLKGKIKFIFIGFIILVVSFYVITEVPFLYNIIGKRIEGLIALLTGEGRADTSTITRKHMIEFGFELFKKRPFLGYGSKNYQVIYGLVHEMDRYAHNNFIELLVNVGLIGTLTYYISNFKIVKDLYKHSKRFNNNELGNLFIAIILTYFLTGISMVYYDNKHYSFLLAVASIIPSVYSKEKENQ